jgi:SAM-dependent methyltransferase
MDVTGDETRAAWAIASRKYEDEYDEHLDEARTVTLLPEEVAALGDLVVGADVVHPMSGHGLDDIALARLGARSVHGLDYSEAALSSAQRRADELGLPCRYTRATMPESGLDDACADLVYTGKGALIWVPDLAAFFAEVHRLLRADGWFYVYEAHPLVPLWAWDPDEARVRPDRSYFAPSHVNDSFPANGAVERQHTLSEIVMTCRRAGFEIEHLDEHPEPFWRPGYLDTAAAWDGRLPNSFSLLARRA